MSFDHDEMGQVTKSKGIFTLGFPYTLAAGEVRWTTTYEAVPYPLAFFGFLFGYSEWSMRLPACLMGTICIGVIGLMGRRFLTGGLVFLRPSSMPVCHSISVGPKMRFTYRKCQLMAMLTCWLFYEAIRTRPIGHKWLTAATVTFCYFLPFMGRNRISFACTVHGLAHGALGSMVVAEGVSSLSLPVFHWSRGRRPILLPHACRGSLSQCGFRSIQSDWTVAFFLAPGYQPMFYIDKLLLSENHVFFTLMILAGLPFCWKSSGFRYVVVMLGTLVCLTYQLSCRALPPLLLLFSATRDHRRRGGDSHAL